MTYAQYGSLEGATAAEIPDWLISTWKTNNRVTVYLIENLPDALWGERVPGAPRRTVRMIGAHLHNNRCMWIKLLGQSKGVAAPKPVDRLTVSRATLIGALDRSCRGIVAIGRAALEQGGTLPPAPWQNVPTDVVHFLAYHVAY